MAKRRVPLHQNPRGFVEVEDGATRGAQLGRDLLDESGRLLTRESLAGGSNTGGPSSIASTIWRLIREIPLNIQKVAALATSGFVVRRSDGEWSTRTLQQGPGITISNPAGEAGDPAIGLADVPDSGAGVLLATTFDAKGRKTGSRPATITGTATQINVANGTAAAGLPTLSLAPEVLAALAEATTALQPSDVAGPNSVKVTPNGSGGIVLQLDNDQLSPAAMTTYSVDASGARGWFRPALFESTGVINGGALSINAGNNARFDMAQAVIGYTDWSVTPTQPTRVVSTVGPFTSQVVTNIATANATYVGIQMPAGTIIQQTSPFTNAQRRTIAQIGVLVHSNNANLNAINDQAATIRAGVNQVGDLMMAIGPLNLTGNVYSANGANLNINKTGGSIFKMGSNFQANNLDPHVVSQSSQTALTFRYRLSNGTEGADATNINPNQYESSPGVLTNIPILGNQWHVQRISLFQSGLTRIQYGQQLYASAQAAINGITTDAFTTEQNIAENGILRCYLIINRGLLGLLGSATFAPVSKFGALQASSGSAPDHNNLSGLQGGSTSERYHLTAAQASIVDATAVGNMLINCNVPIINQDVFAGGAMVAGAYGYDMWKAGTGGCSVSINLTTGVFTHTSGPLQQIVESPANAWGSPLTLSVSDPSGNISVSIGGATGTITAGSGRRSVTVTPTGSGNMTVQLTATGVTYSLPKLERGSVATAFAYRPVEQELALCLRYYEKSFNQAIAPAPNTAASFVSGMMLDYVFAGLTYRKFVACKVPKRASGSVTIFNPQASNNQVRVRDTVDCTSTVAYPSESGFVVEAGIPSGTFVPAEMWFHWVYNARL